MHTQPTSATIVSSHMYNVQTCACMLCMHGVHARNVPNMCMAVSCRWQPWRWITYSCNGFHEEAPEKKYGGIGNLWRDVMSRHIQQPYHLQVRWLLFRRPCLCMCTAWLTQLPVNRLPIVLHLYDSRPMYCICTIAAHCTAFVR
jgi:hypothetical protein